MAENKNDFIATKTLFLDKDGKIVGEDDPTRLTKLVHAGGRLPQAEAAKYGLAGAQEAQVFTAPERIYFDKAQKVVGDDSPAKETLIIAKGSTMPRAEAETIGLVEPEPVKAEKTAEKAKPAAEKAKVAALDVKPEAKPAVPAPAAPVGSGLGATQSKEKKIV